MFVIFFLLNPNLQNINSCKNMDINGIFSPFHMIFYSLLKICIIMQIIHIMMTRDVIYPIIF